MNLLKTHKLLLLTSAVTVIVVAGLTVTITWAAGITFEGGQPEPAQGAYSGVEPRNADSSAFQTPPAWVADPGDNAGGSFSFCVETLDLSVTTAAAASIRDQAKDAIDSAIQAVRSHGSWPVSGLEASLPATYVEGCPQAPYPTTTSGEWKNGEYLGGYGEISGRSDAKSPYSFFVFVLPLDKIEGLLGGTSDRVVRQELEFHGDEINTVSRGIYLTPDEVGDASFVAQTIEYALGFRH